MGAARSAFDTGGLTCSENAERRSNTGRAASWDTCSANARREFQCAGGFPKVNVAALPIVCATIYGRASRALVDSGSKMSVATDTYRERFKGERSGSDRSGRLESVM